MKKLILLALMILVVPLVIGGSSFAKGGVDAGTTTTTTPVTPTTVVDPAVPAVPLPVPVDPVVVAAIPTPEPAPVPPCAEFIHDPDFSAINVANKDLTKPLFLPIKFTLKSCSTVAQSLVVNFTDNDHLPLDEAPTMYSQCMLAPFSSAVMTLKPGETRSFKMQSPAITPLPDGCFVQHIFKQVAVDSFTGAVLNSDWQLIAVQSRF